MSDKTVSVDQVILIESILSQINKDLLAMQQFATETFFTDNPYPVNCVIQLIVSTDLLQVSLIRAHEDNGEITSRGSRHSRQVSLERQDCSCTHRLFAA